MNDLELLVDLHGKTERQGPGSEKDTLKALSYVNLPDKSDVKIADIGCGSGSQTITLAKKLNGHITAVDIFDSFLKNLSINAEREKVQDQISLLKASMDELPFAKESFDLIWSEGAIYIMGFENGIRNWGKFLKPGGYLAVSEITWLIQSRPQELENYWTSEYPEINTAANKILQLEQNGYILSGYFTLDSTSWLDHYYEPLLSHFDSFLERHNNSQEAKEIVDMNKAEIEYYKKYKDYYSYGFYIAKKQ